MIYYDNLTSDNKKIVAEVLKKHNTSTEVQSATIFNCYVQVYNKRIVVDGALYTKDLKCLLEISEKLSQV